MCIHSSMHRTFTLTVHIICTVELSVASFLQRKGSCVLFIARLSFQSAATVSVRPVERSSVGSESEGSSSDEETGRFKVKSAVVQVSAEGTHVLYIHILHFSLCRLERKILPPPLCPIPPPLFHMTHYQLTPYHLYMSG